jgi:hypothetical protein
MGRLGHRVSPWQPSGQWVEALQCGPCPPHGWARGCCAAGPGDMRRRLWGPCAHSSPYIVEPELHRQVLGRGELVVVDQRRGAVPVGRLGDRVDRRQAAVDGPFEGCCWEGGVGGGRREVPEVAAVCLVLWGAVVLGSMYGSRRADTCRRAPLLAARRMHPQAGSPARGPPAHPTWSTATCQLSGRMAATTAVTQPP